MNIDLWLAFVFASVILIAIPGPTNLMVMAYGFRHGKKAAFFTVFGIGPGAVVAMALSYLGLGGILATSIHLFMLMKWIGAVYLIYMGINLWQSTSNLDDVLIEDKSVAGRQIAFRAFTISLLNPKHIIFYMAFIPQFISPDSPILRQILIMSFTFIILVIPINMAYALISGTLKDMINNQKVLKAMNRTGGGLLIGAGLLTALLRRSR